LEFFSDLLWYLFLINFIALGAMLLDKAATKAHGWRLSELTIFVLFLIGGVWGTMAAMSLFHHKTAKPDFQAVIFLIMILNLVLLHRLLA